MLLAVLSILAYAGAAALITSRLFHQQGPVHIVSLVLAAIGLVTHGVQLWDSILLEPGQNMSMTNVASLIAWLIALSMSAAIFKIANAILLPVVYGFAAFVILLGMVLPGAYIMHIDVQPGLLIHISLALLAYGCLMIALLYAFQLAYINTRLKQKQASLLHSSLPPLMAVEQILFKLLLAGTLLLTLSLLSGFAFLDGMFAKEQAHKTVFSILAWLVFGFLLIGHQRWGWRGKPVISATVVGAVLLTLAYFGSRFVREVILS